MSHNKVLILDYGSQFTQLITRRIRELNVYSEIHRFDYPFEKIAEDKTIRAIILSGGPNSVYDDGAPGLDKRILELGIPVLGICYGLQIMAHTLGGVVEASAKREYGRATFTHQDELLGAQALFADIPTESSIWMSHGDHVVRLPDGFECIGSTDNCPISAVADARRKLYGLQFHPEVHHSDQGRAMIANFLFTIAEIKTDWTTANFVEEKVEQIRAQVGDEQVLCGLSGGVDSSVAAALIHKAIGDKLHCVFVDHGLLRLNEREEVERVFRGHFHVHLTTVDAADYFLSRLAGVTDPETKRKIIGEAFVRIFEETQHCIEDNPKRLVVDVNGVFSNPDGELKRTEHLPFAFLAQGTLYPDVIESVSSTGGPSHTIKSHHNVGGLPEDMKFKLVEPFRDLFKDEVRRVGRELGVPDVIVDRHPFPGPGLGIRIIGEVTKEKLDVLREADNIFISELKSNTTFEWIENGSKDNHLIFDFDGVLADTADAFIQALQDHPEFMDEKFIDVKEKVIFKKNKVDNFKKPEYFEPDFIKKETEARQWVGEKLKEIGFDIFTDFVEKIKKIPNKKIAIVSSGSKNYVQEYAEKTGLHFTHILCFEDSPSKDEKVRLIAKDWGVDLTEIQFFTDTQNDVHELKDVLPEHNIFGCSWGFHGYKVLREILPKEQILHKFSDIFKVVNRKQTRLYDQVWQAFAVLTEVKSVGVMGDGRTYENLLGLRAVTAVDGMTADWAHLPYPFLATVSNRIINEVKGVNRVAYDISSKPPATIEWE